MPFPWMVVPDWEIGRQGNAQGIQFCSYSCCLGTLKFSFLVILIAWELWKHRNAAVFEGISPNV
jgi:hypothetical protein